MNTHTDITVLEHLLVFNLDVHIWSARKKLQPIDLGDAELPPDDLASLGSKRVCNPDDLKIFFTLKSRASSLLERRGVRFLSGWAIPEDRVDEISRGLADIRDTFNAAKEAFLKRYEQAVDDWIASHPDWKGIIANSTVSQDYVRSRMDFRWQAFRIVSPDETRDELRDNLQEDVQNLGGTLFDEIARMASETWARCYEGKTEITRKALSPLKTIHDKLMGLTFIEPRVEPVASLIRTAFESIPARGPINGGTLLMLQGLVGLLRNPQDLLLHGQKILEGQKPDDILSGFNALPAALPDLGSPDSADESLPESLPMPPAALGMDSCGLW